MALALAWDAYWCLDAVKRFGMGVPWLNGLAWGSVQFTRGHPAEFEQRVTLHVVQTPRGGPALIEHSPINMFKLRGVAPRALNSRVRPLNFLCNQTKSWAPGHPRSLNNV